MDEKLQKKLLITEIHKAIIKTFLFLFPLLFSDFCWIFFVAAFFTVNKTFLYGAKLYVAKNIQ